MVGDLFGAHNYATTACGADYMIFVFVDEDTPPSLRLARFLLLDFTRIPPCITGTYSVYVGKFTRFSVRVFYGVATCHPSFRDAIPAALFPLACMQFVVIFAVAITVNYWVE